jgi:hypothetical protein
VRQGGLAQAWGAVEQHVIQCLLALARRLNKNLKVIKNLYLTGKVVESRRPKALLGFAIVHL